MNKKTISAIVILGLITVIPTVYGQLTLGSEAKQESIEVKINIDGEINVKHIVSSSNMPSSLPLFTGEILNLINNFLNEKNSFIFESVENRQSMMRPARKQIIIGLISHFRRIRELTFHSRTVDFSRCIS